MPSHARLRRSSDVAAAFRDGAVGRGRTVTVRLRWRGDAGPQRATVTTTKGVGSAVRRNRAKRRVRAALREQPPARGADVVVVARPVARTVPFPTLREDVRTAREEAVRRGAGAAP